MCMSASVTPYAPAPTTGPPRERALLALSSHKRTSYAAIPIDYDGTAPCNFPAATRDSLDSGAPPPFLPPGRGSNVVNPPPRTLEQSQGSSVGADNSIVTNALAALNASRCTTWMYRIRPSVAHRQIVKSNLNPDLETCFSPLNPKVEYVAAQQAWDPFPLPDGSEAVDFVSGIKTIGGQGDPALKEGVAVHIYSANASMSNRAFCNNDGDFLILPQQGRLNVQTELGRMMVRPGELLVIQAGIRFKVTLPDGPVRGYVQEIFGNHYDLPELGPVGSNGMALPRDFESPVASFDIDSTPWEIVYKLAGSLQICHQSHSPFDVVAWHGNYVPYKYAIEKFVNMANVDKDQADPTIYCVLTAKSKVPGASISDFLVFTPKWIPTSNTFRPPYYHRNMSTEVMGLIYGRYGGSSHVLEPGGLSYEASFMPHGETYDTWKQATTRKLVPERICEDTIAWMFHMGVPLLLTDWAMKGRGATSLHCTDVGQWDDLTAHFLEHLDDVNKELAAAGLPSLGEHVMPDVVKKANGVNGVDGLKVLNGAANGVNGVNGVKHACSSS